MSDEFDAPLTARLRIDAAWLKRRGNETVARDVEEAIAALEAEPATAGPPSVDWDAAADAAALMAEPFPQGTDERCIAINGFLQGVKWLATQAASDQPAQAPAAPAEAMQWRAAVDKLGNLRSFLNGWKGSGACSRNNMEAEVGQWIEGLTELHRLYDLAGPQAPAYPSSIPKGADDIVRTIALGLERGYTPASLLDENSPVRDRIREYIAAPQAAQPPQEPDQNMRRLTGLWRFGRAVLPNGTVDFQAWLFQLDGFIDAKAPNPRPCTCHPDDNPPKPCPRRYALSECRAAAAESAQPVAPAARSEPLVHIQPDARKGKPPCGECHLQPGETCDICGAREAGTQHGEQTPGQAPSGQGSAPSQDT